MRIFFAILSLSLNAAPAFAADLSAISGIWKTDNSGGQVEFYDCGDGTPCGRLTNLTDPSFIDSFNPDPALRTRHLNGVTILDGFKAKKDGRFKKGKIYNPRDGKSYRSSLSLTDDGQLQVKGCVFVFCQSQYWARPVEAERGNIKSSR